MYVFDLDNTLSDAEHRSHLARNKLWDDFHIRAEHDEAVPAIKSLCEALWNGGKQIVILTGRPEKYRNITTNWLQKQSIRFDGLLMRPNDDFRQDYDFKAHMLQMLCNSECLQPSSIVVFEDRDTVVKALRPLGYTVLQVRDSLY